MAVVHNFVYGVVITQTRHMTVFGALEMTLIFKYVAGIIALVGTVLSDCVYINTDSQMQ